MRPRKQSSQGLSNRTPFQLHKSQSSCFDSVRHEVYDFAEYKLRYMAIGSSNPERQRFLYDLVRRYRRGEVAIAFEHGEPTFIPVTRG